MKDKLKTLDELVGRLERLDEELPAITTIEDCVHKIIALQAEIIKELAEKKTE